MAFGFSRRRWMRLAATNVIGLGVLLGGTLGGFAQSTGGNPITSGNPTGPGPSPGPTTSVATVPEPTSLALLISGIGALSFVSARYRRRLARRARDNHPEP